MLSLGPVWWAIAIAAVIFWSLVRLVIQNENVSQRATLARQIVVEIDLAYGELQQNLHHRVPGPFILRAHQATMARAQTAVSREIWPFPGYRPPREAYQPELDRVIDEIRENCMAGWDPPQPGQEF